MVQTVIIGFDGATFDVVDDIEARMPNLSSLMADGYHADLSSTDPPFTSVAWPAFVTGQNPGRFGLFDFIGHDPGTSDFYLNDTRKKDFEYFWDYIREGIGLASIPMVPYNDNCSFFVQGSLARVNEDLITQPPDLADRLPEYYDHQFDWEDDKDEIVESELRRIGAREELFCELVSTYDIPLYFLMFQAVDHLQHHFWAFMDEEHEAHRPSDYADAIPRLYERVDEAIGRILDCFDEPVNVVVASDHGFTGVDVEVDLDNFLAANGYTASDTSIESVSTSLGMKLKKLADGSVLEYLVPGWLKRRVSSQLPDESDMADQLDWEQTEVYRFGASPGMYINLEGRQQNGIVPESEFSKLKNRLADDLRALRGPDGEELIEFVADKDDVYEGYYVDHAPDLVVRGAGGVRLWAGLDKGQTVARSERAMPNSGMHAQDGILVASGPDFRDVEARGTADIIDVAPTLLNALGYGAPEQMDGEAITGALDNPSSTVSKPVRSERTRIKNRVLSLRQLQEV